MTSSSYYGDATGSIGPPPPELTSTHCLKPCLLTTATVPLVVKPPQQQLSNGGGGGDSGSLRRYAFGYGDSYGDGGSFSPSFNKDSCASTGSWGNEGGSFRGGGGAGAGGDGSGADSGHRHVTIVCECENGVTPGTSNAGKCHSGNSGGGGIRINGGGRGDIADVNDTNGGGCERDGDGGHRNSATGDGGDGCRDAGRNLAIPMGSRHSSPLSPPALSSPALPLADAAVTSAPPTLITTTYPPTPTPPPTPAAAQPSCPILQHTATLHATLTIRPDSLSPASIAANATVNTTTTTATAAVQSHLSSMHNGGEVLTPATTATASATFEADPGARHGSMAATAAATTTATAAPAAAAAVDTVGTDDITITAQGPLCIPPPPPPPPPTVTQRLTFTLREWCTAAGAASAAAVAVTGTARQHGGKLDAFSKSSFRRTTRGAQNRHTVPFGFSPHQVPVAGVGAGRYGGIGGGGGGGSCFHRLLRSPCCGRNTFWLAATALLATVPLLLVVLLPKVNLPDLRSRAADAVGGAMQLGGVNVATASAASASHLAAWTGRYPTDRYHYSHGGGGSGSGSGGGGGGGGQSQVDTISFGSNIQSGTLAAARLVRPSRGDPSSDASLSRPPSGGAAGPLWHVTMADFRSKPVQLSVALDLARWRHLPLSLPTVQVPTPPPPPPPPPPSGVSYSFGTSYVKPRVGAELASDESVQISGGDSQDKRGSGEGDDGHVGGMSGGGGGRGPDEGAKEMAAFPAGAPLPRCPQWGHRVRVLVAVISKCCDSESSAKRAAIRESWGAYLRSYLYDCMDLLFVLAQPSPHLVRQAATVLQLEAASAAAAAVIAGGRGGVDVSGGGDFVFVPGLDTYRNLPSKSMRMLQLALSSPLQYTHIVKCDDDVFVRPQRLLYDVILKPPTEWMSDYGRGPVELAATARGGGVIMRDDEDLPDSGSSSTDSSTGGSSSSSSTGAGIIKGKLSEGLGEEQDRNATGGVVASYMGRGSVKDGSSGLFCGGVSGWFSHAEDGFRPIRDTTSKWYLSSAELSDEEAPLGVPYPVGWMYVLSRDAAQRALAKAVYYSQQLSAAPPWWGRLPWEDVMLGALLWGEVPLRNHPGFKHPFMGCGDDTVAKHLDNLAPELQRPLQTADWTGKWSGPGGPVDCTRGAFKADNFTDWRRWRNEQPDVAITGRI